MGNSGAVFLSLTMEWQRLQLHNDRHKVAIHSSNEFSKHAMGSSSEKCLVRSLKYTVIDMVWVYENRDRMINSN